MMMMFSIYLVYLFGDMVMITDDDYLFIYLVMMMMQG
jgi:hypothetical protein